MASPERLVPRSRTAHARPGNRASRRAFLRRASSLSVAGAAAPWALNFAALGEAAAAGARDYKALVCVFLYGGNHRANTLAPFDPAHHEQYRLLRPNLAHSRIALGGTVLQTTTPALDRLGVPVQYALAPESSPRSCRCGRRQLAPGAERGHPRAAHHQGSSTRARSVPLPPKLFSHNDQQSVWQASAAEGAVSGWGGRMAELLRVGQRPAPPSAA
jgi:uncharacterized protein (DUF1501 family)